MPASEQVAQNLVTGENFQAFAMQKLGLDTAPEPAAESTEAPAGDDEDAAAEPEAAAESDAKPAGDEDKKPSEKSTEPKKRGISERISDLTRARREAESRAAAAEARAAEQEARLRALESAQKARAEPEKAPDPTGRPDPTKFTDAIEYAERLAEWTVAQKLAERDAEEARRRAETERTERINAYQKRLQDTRAELEDYDDIVGARTDLVVSDAVRDAILESAWGPRIVYHLAQNPDEVGKLAQMSPLAANRYLGRLEASFERSAEPEKAPARQAAPVKRSAAPEPINPLRGVNETPETLIDANGEFRGTIAQYKALRRAGKIK